MNIPFEQHSEQHNCATMITSPIRAVIFDLDGTLLDTAPDFVVVVNQLRAEYQLPPLPAERIRASVSNGARALVCMAFDIDDKAPQYELLRERLLALYLNHLAVHTELFPGIDELLQTLNAHNIPWGIATNKPAVYTEALLEALDIQPAPISVICPDHVRERKPHPESLLLASQHIGCSPGEIIYIGDHKRDIDCGRSAGAITIAAAYGYIETDDDIDLWEAHYRVEHANEIWPIIAQLIADREQAVDLSR
jgi:2-phosphoglycolate phosphatase